MSLILYILIGICFWFLLYWAGKNYKTHPFKWDPIRHIQKLLWEGPYDGFTRRVEPVQLAVITCLFGAIWPATTVYYVAIRGLKRVTEYIQNTLTGAEGHITKLFAPFTMDPEDTE